MSYAFSGYLEGEKDNKFGGTYPNLSFLNGKQIVKAGWIDSSNLSREQTCPGGLAFDYLQDGILMRVVFGFTELGFWISWQGKVGEANDKDILMDKVKAFLEKLERVNPKIVLSGDGLKAILKKKVIFEMSKQELELCNMTNLIEEYKSKEITYKDFSYRLFLRLGFFI